MISAKKNNFIVEFRPSTIRAARVSSETAPTVIEEVVEIDLGKESDPAAAVRDFANVKSNAYLNASCTAYPKGRVVRQLVVESQRGKEADFVMDFLRNSVGVDPDGFSAYCLTADGGGDLDLSNANKKSIVLCGASTDAISETQKTLVEHGVYPRRLEIGTIGIIGAINDTMNGDPGRSPVLFLEIDSEVTHVAIVGPKGVEMARQIDSGATHIAQALKEEMNLKDEAAAEKILKSRDFDLGSIAPKLLRKMLRELQSSIGFFEVQTGSSVSELYCLKDGRSLPWLEESICDLLNLSSFQVDFDSWFESKKVSFASDSVAGKIDGTWLSILSLLMEFKGGEAES